MMPNALEINSVKQKFATIAHLPDVIGAIDGTHIRIVCPSFNLREVYWCRKQFYSINTQVVGDADLRIRNIVARWPGSTHDSRIFTNSNICSKRERGDFNEGYLLGDGGYACRPYLLTPFLNPQTRQQQQRYNSAHSRTRCTVERLIGVWKKRFPCLHYGLRCHLRNNLVVIVACAVLHNIAIKMNEPVDLFTDLLPEMPDTNNSTSALSCSRSDLIKNEIK